MARLLCYIYRITIPAPPGMTDVVLDLTVMSAGHWIEVTDAPEQLEYLRGRSPDYVWGFCTGRNWKLEFIQVWDPVIVPDAVVSAP